MTRLGIVARADDGGLGNQTRDVVRHLAPDFVLIVLLGESARGREWAMRIENPNGPLHETRYVNPGPRLFDEGIDAALRFCDVLYTVEGPYHGDGVELFRRCETAGVELVIHANPELYKGFPCHRLLVPTTWRLDQMPMSATVLPHPIDIDVFTPFERNEEPTFVHLTGPAMLDRQGTNLVLSALQYVEQSCVVMIRRSDHSLVSDRVGNVRIEWLPAAADHWEAIPSGAWALIQPRRYGGLSLCIQEAAARGMFTIALDREPESTFYEQVTMRVAMTEEQPYPMAGGEVGVGDTDPRRLAAAIDEFVDHELTTGINWSRPRAWAEEHSWGKLLPDYETILR